MLKIYEYSLFKKYAEQAKINNPSKVEEIDDIFNLALSEIEIGESEYNECMLAINDINDQISED